MRVEEEGVKVMPAEEHEARRKNREESRA